MRPVHWLAECKDCGKTWELANAVPLAVQHSKKTGHEIGAEVMLSGHWKAGKKL